MRLKRVLRGLFVWAAISLLLSSAAFAEGCKNLLTLKIAEVYNSKTGVGPVTEFDRYVYAKSNGSHREDFLHIKPVRYVIENSPFGDKYQEILDKVSDPVKYHWTEALLSNLEVYHRVQKVENYASWINFIASSRSIELSHRLYEGFYALSILKTMNVTVSFEPGRGFFSLPTDKNSTKSMDLRLTDSLTRKVVAYREVKRVQSSQNVFGAVKSSFAKADFALTRLKEKVELSAVLFIEGDLLDHNVADGMTEADFYPIAIKRILYEFSIRRPASLDAILVIHLKLNRFTKIYQLPDGQTQVEHGTFF
ncbi:MAG: hypothetical protein WCK43_02345 [bacterium]